MSFLEHDVAVKFDTGFLALCIRLLPNGMEMGDEEAREKLLEELLNDALTGPTARIATLDLKKLAHRELPPGNWAQLYLLFQAFCLANDCLCQQSCFLQSHQALEKSSQVQASVKAQHL